MILAAKVAETQTGSGELNEKEKKSQKR